jgi:hypothetical protein
MIRQLHTKKLWWAMTQLKWLRAMKSKIESMRVDLVIRGVREHPLDTVRFAFRFDLPSRYSRPSNGREIPHLPPPPPISSPTSASHRQRRAARRPWARRVPPAGAVLPRRVPPSRRRCPATWNSPKRPPPRIFRQMEGTGSRQLRRRGLVRGRSVLAVPLQRRRRGGEEGSLDGGGEGSCAATGGGRKSAPRQQA